MHPATQAILRFFSFDHLPEGAARDTSRAFSIMAHGLAEAMPPSAETTAGLRKLLEAKDCFVRAALPVEPDLRSFADLAREAADRG